MKLLKFGNINREGSHLPYIGVRLGSEGRMEKQRSSFVGEGEGMRRRLTGETWLASDTPRMRHASEPAWAALRMCRWVGHGAGLQGVGQ